MKRRLAALALVAATSIGLAACSSNNSAKEESNQPPAAVQEDTAKEAEKATEESAKEEVTQPAPDEVDPYYGVDAANESCQAVIDAQGDGSDVANADFSTPEGAQQYVDAMRGQADRIGAVLPNISDESVKGAAQSLQETLLAFTDGMEKVYVNGDPSAQQDFAAAGEAYGQAVESFAQICLPGAFQ